MDDVFADLIVCKSFSHFCCLVVDMTMYKLSKKEKRQLKEVFTHIDNVDLNTTKYFQHFKIKLKKVLAAIDYGAARERRIKANQKKLLNKPFNPKTTVTKTSNNEWRMKFLTKYRDKSYYSKLVESERLSNIDTDIRNCPTIGLGIDSIIKLPKIKSHEVLLDKNREIIGKADHKHHLYTAGWSLYGHFSDEEEEE